MSERARSTSTSSLIGKHLLADQRHPQPLELEAGKVQLELTVLLAEALAARRCDGARARDGGGVRVAFAADPEVALSTATSDGSGSHLQPAIERGEVHARRRGGRRERDTAPTARSGFPSPTRPGHRSRGSGSDLRGFQQSETGSGFARGPVWVSRSRSGSWSSTAGGSGSRASSAAGAPSPSRCPRGRPRHDGRADPRRRRQREEHEAVP